MTNGRRLHEQLVDNTGPRNVLQFVSAVVLIALVAYFLKGRDNGLAFWEVLVSAAIFVGLEIAVRAVIQHFRRD